jgi:surfeit locus 1 family protein
MARRHDRALIWAGASTLVGVAVLVALGIWQLERRQWKLDLLARIEARMAAPAGPVPAEADWPGWNADAQEYRRVRLTGEFLPAKAAPVHGNSPRDSRTGEVQLGFFLLTPLRLDDGAIVIVNRGFVPLELRTAVNHAAAGGDPRVTVTGLMRAPQERGWFVPEDDPARNEWFTRDPGAIARAKGLARVAPFIVDADAASNPASSSLENSPFETWPRGGLTVVNFPNNHLQYALTWFGLAAALAGVFAAFAWRRPAQCGSQA